MKQIQLMKPNTSLMKRISTYCDGLDGINFSYSKFTEEEDLVHYEDN